jgi:voltage-gated potassium channel
MQRKVEIESRASGITLISFWTEFMGQPSDFVFEVRILSTFVFFVALAYILIRNILSSEVVNHKVIFGAMAGYIIIGLIGVTLFEFIQYVDPASVRFTQDQSGYDFYYYSFISLITIGYGDIVPQSPQTKSLAILLGIIGQFYMAIGVALFIGRHLNEKNKSSS